MSDISQEDSKSEIIKTIELVKDRPTLRDIYDGIYSIISTYMDLPEEYKKIVSLWSIAAALKDCFVTFPVLFINASKGSGKTRLLKVLESIIPHARLTPNLTEASLFRLPAQQKLNALLIDEAERLSYKEKGNLRELLNQAYKRGGSVLRVEDDKSGGKVVKEYPVFMGLALANIWGLEPVLEDRCITIVLEKSKNKEITKIPEFFELDDRIAWIKKSLSVYVVYVGSLFSGVGEFFFIHLLSNIIDTLPTHHTQQQQHTQPTPILHEKTISKDFPTNPNLFCEVLKESTLLGRDMELWLPLLTVAAGISEEFFIETVNLAQHVCEEKKSREIVEDRDSVFSIFLYYYIRANNIKDMVSIRKLRTKFIELEGEKKWLSSEWVGRCLRRIRVIKNKRRMARGMEVEINMANLSEYINRRGIETTDELVEGYVDEEYEEQLSLGVPDELKRRGSK